MPDVKYNNGKEALLNGDIDLTNDTIKLALFPNTYTVNIDTQQFWSDVSGSEISGTNYTAGGNALAGKTVTQNNTTDRAVFDANDVVFTNVTLSNCRYGVLYKDTGTPATSPLIAQFDWGADQSPSGVDFTVVWNASGILDLA